MADTASSNTEIGHSRRTGNALQKKFIDDCVDEKKRLPENFPIATMLLDEAVDRVYATGGVPGRDLLANVFNQKLIKVSQKVYVPTKEFPKFNFVGKLIGPKGSSLRDLEKETLCRILIKGRNSERNQRIEEENRESGDPRYAHLKKDLYYEISTVATPAEAHARVAYALTEIRKFLVPDSNDEVSRSQRKEILSDPVLSKKVSRTLFGEGHQVTALSILNKIRPNSEECSNWQSKSGPSEPNQNNKEAEEPPLETKKPKGILKKVPAIEYQVNEDNKEEIEDKEKEEEEEKVASEISPSAPSLTGRKRLVVDLHTSKIAVKRPRALK